MFKAFVSAFMHGGFGHLFGNMLVLFLVGFLVESVIGKGLYAFAYFVAIFGSALMYSVTSPGTSCLGASGAIAGVMGLYSVIFGFRKIDFFYSSDSISTTSKLRQLRYCRYGWAMSFTSS